MSSAGTGELKGREFEDGNGMPSPEGGHQVPDSGRQESPGIRMAFDSNTTS